MRKPTILVNSKLFNLEGRAVRCIRTEYENGLVLYEIEDLLTGKKTVAKTDLLPYKNLTARSGVENV